VQFRVVKSKNLEKSFPELVKVNVEVAVVAGVELIAKIQGYRSADKYSNNLLAALGWIATWFLGRGFAVAFRGYRNMVAIEDSIDY
jgi:hypothetical protein